jgi:hemerythrin superfamily protein
MTAIDILKKDHRKVDDLFTQIESEGSDRKQIFGQIYNELTMHSQAEETFFYPELELSSETSGDVQHSYKEHQQVKDMLEELAASDPNAAVWMTKLNELKESVLHHVEEEEGELFPKSEQVLGQAKLEEIGRKIEQLKKKSKDSGFRAA